MELRCIFLELGLFLGAANFTSNKPTMIAGDSIKAKAPTINPSKFMFWLSKKLSAGLDALVLDIKCGNGAFMNSKKKATYLAKSLVEVGNG